MLRHDDCFNVLPGLPKNSVDLILTDPPYAISKDSNFDRISETTPESMARKYNYSTDFGEWDRDEIDLDRLFRESYRILRKGGTMILFYDIWKANLVKEAAKKACFKQPRICQWVKSNPMPVNSKSNYLSNSVEFFFTFVKAGKPTFNSEYDSGIYNFPFSNGNQRKDFYHPTQKPISLITSILLKHSNPGDLVLDPFAGSGTLGEACLENGRRFLLVEREAEYCEIIRKRLNKHGGCQYNAYEENNGS